MTQAFVFVGSASLNFAVDSHLEWWLSIPSIYAPVIQYSCLEKKKKKPNVLILAFARSTLTKHISNNREKINNHHESPIPSALGTHFFLDLLGTQKIRVQLAFKT